MLNSRYWYIVFFLFFVPAASVLGQNDSVHSVNANLVNKKKLTAVVAGGSALYAAGMTGLYTIWYKDYPQSSFHFFNDSKEWMQVDKAGHGTTAYFVSYLGYESLRYSGLDNSRSALLGGLSSWLFLTTIEVFDGFSAQWGASVSDLAANTLGCALFTSQQLVWKEQKVLLKWSYHQTRFPTYRPDLLGNGFAERMLKDYNGQTYWISVNMKSFMHEGSGFPAWLNIAFGFGAEGMTGASKNSMTYLGKEIPSFDRYRQFYIGPDLDLTRIKTRSVVINSIFKTFGFIRLPLPVIEINNHGARFHPLYF